MVSEVKPIVYNLEPKDYSSKAKEIWEAKGFIYVEGSWNGYTTYTKKSEVIILITRLGGIIENNILSEFKNLKYLISATTGLNHIDLNLISKKGIELISLRNHEAFLDTIPSTAELTIGLILNALRPICHANLAVRNGKWNREEFKGYQLKNKRLGIIGLGRIGRKVASIASSFNMKVSYYDPGVFSNLFDKTKSINELLELSDIITIHIHADKENLNFFNEDLIKKTKPGVVIVNTSRGEIWDEKSIINYLDNGHIAMICSDVLSNEQKNLESNPLWQRRNDKRVLLTPHIGGATYDAMWDCELFTQEIVLKKIIHS